MLPNPRAMRILDLPRALEAGTDDGPSTIVVRIDAPMCPHNEGNWRIDAGPEGCDLHPCPR